MIYVIVFTAKSKESGEWASRVSGTKDNLGEEKAFFPCYTSLDAMEKYEDCYAKIPINFMDAVDLALSYPYQKLDGMVVNAFTTPVELSRAELRKIKRSER